MKHFPAFLIAAVVALAGCMVGPNYHRPKVEAPAEWASPLAGGETNLGVAGGEWWTAFADPELNSLIARGSQSNLNVRAAVWRLRESRAALKHTRGGLGPTLDTAASFSESRYAANGFPPFPPGIPLEADVYQAGFDAAWELDIFGGVRRSVEAAKAGVAASEFGRRNVLLSVQAEIARNYMEARAYERRLQVALENIKAQESIVSLTSDLYSHGLTSQLDVEQAKSLLATTQAATPSLESGYKAAAYHLAVLLGQAPGALLGELGQSQQAKYPLPIVPVGLPAELLRRRPDVRQAERQLAAATAQIGVATADLFPKFSLTGEVGLQSVSASDWFTAGSRYWSAGPTAQWRLFDTGRIRANIRVQNARQEQALAAYEQTALGAFEDAENALTGYANEQLRRQSLQRAEESDKAALDLAQRLYGNGLADFLRVLESQRALYLTQDAVIESDRAVSFNLIALYKALGGSWEP